MANQSHHTTEARSIPVRRAGPNDPVPLDYGTTPGGTIFSTTPRGTRIVYDRNQLLALSNSPLAQTPPARMNSIPGITSESVAALRSQINHMLPNHSAAAAPFASSSSSSAMPSATHLRPAMAIPSGEAHHDMVNSFGSSQRSDLRVPPNTPANKSVASVLAARRGSHDASVDATVPKMAAMHLPDVDEDAGLDSPTHNNDKDKPAGVFELE
ncbi:Eukaryotic translation initiation factor 4E-binding protein 2, partial [Dimargaris xerosporica]